MSSLLIALVLAASSSTLQIPSENAPPQSKTYHVGGSVLPPVLVSSTEPVYPRSLWHKNTDHRVLVQLVVDTDGLPQNLKVLTSGGKPFDDAALKAVRTYHFKPSTELGKPVSAQIVIDVQFKVL